VAALHGYPLTVRAAIGQGALACLRGRARQAVPRAAHVRAAGRGAGLLVAAVVLCWLYLRQARTIWVTSDGAANALQAWDMLHGNVLLHGWWLSDVSFFTTELPEYALVEAVRGLDAAVIWTSAAITYTLLVVLTGLLAAGPPGKPARERLAGGLLGAGIVLAPSSVLGTPMLISSPNHAGTAVPLLVTLLLVDRLAGAAVPGRRWGPVPATVALPAVVGLLLAWVQVADQVGLFAGALPVALACGIRFAVRRERLDLALAAAAVASVPLSLAALRAISALGGFAVAPVTTAGSAVIAPLTQLPVHARLLAESVAVIFGANYFGQRSAALRLIAVVHLAGLAVAVLGLAIAVWLLSRRRLDRVSGALTAGVLILLAAGLLGTHLVNVLSAHEIVVIAPFGATLAGRMLGGALARPRWRLLLGAGLVAYLGFLCYDGSLPSHGAGGQPVADWLARHRMAAGVAGYWQADVMTLASGGRVTVAPVQLSDGSAYHWEAKASWFDPGLHHATFAISPPNATPLTSAARPRALFGPPAAVYHVAGYVIQVWNRNVLPDVQRATPAPGRAP
jgi:hypothetical protein